jgi:hypothetical protein
VMTAADWICGGAVQGSIAAGKSKVPSVMSHNRAKQGCNWRAKAQFARIQACNARQQEAGLPRQGFRRRQLVLYRLPEYDTT